MLKLILSALFLDLVSCLAVTKNYQAYSNLDYVNASANDYDAVRHKLDIYAPKGKASSGKVLVFIHGGSWNTGKKSLYRFLGRAFAQNGIVTVVINYRLSPQARYNDMAYDAARAVAWIYQNIETYGGNKREIFLAGHSAGGQLAALLTVDPSYFAKAGASDVSIKGCILNDPFGLNIDRYLTEGHKDDESFRYTFTNSPDTWKKASPFFYIKKNPIKYYILRGEETYPSIIKDSEDFHKRNSEVGNTSQLHSIAGKKHTPMILLFFFKNNTELKKVVDFIKQS